MGKAAIYNPYLDTLGGGERYTLSFAKVLSEMGYQVDIHWNNEAILDQLSDRFEIKLSDSIRVVDDIKRGEGYDVCFWVSDGSIPLLRARKNLLHFQVPFKGVNGNSLMNKMKLFRIEKIICNSFFTKNVIDAEYGVESIVIHPAVDTLKIKPKRKTNIILYVGRFSNLTQNKGQLYLIKAFKRFVSTHGYEDWKLVLAGGVEVGVGEFLNTLKKKSENYNIEIIPSPDYAKLKDLYGHSKIFWSAAGFGIDEKKHPEKTEHFGISLVEAMAGGAVPLVYRAGGHLEIVKDAISGILWNDLDQLVAKTKDIVSDTTNLKIFSKTAVYASKKFSYEEFKNKIKTIY